MAGEVAVEGPAAATEVGDSIEQSHMLERKWTFWFDNQSRPKQGAEWGSSLRKVYTFDTVEEFWWYVLRSLSLPMIKLVLFSVFFERWATILFIFFFFDLWFRAFVQFLRSDIEAEQVAG